MCRAKAEGGRRCECDRPPLTGEALERHNARRRQNRALRSAAVAWARENGVPDTAVAVLAAARPGVVREWAALAGAPTSVVEATNVRRLDPSPVREAYWATPRIVSMIAAASSTQGKHPAEAELLAGQVEWTEGVYEGVNSTRWVQLDNGTEGFHKAFTGLHDEIAEEYGHEGGLQPIHEVAAWVLARELGEPWSRLVPPCVLRPIDGRLGSFSRRVPGDSISPLGSVPSDDIEAAALFDALTGQQDRHSSNLLVEDEQLALIDHGFAFGRPGDYFNASMLVGYRNRSQPDLHEHELRALRRLVESSDLLGVGGLLEPERGAAMWDRANRMLTTGRLLDRGDL